VLVPSGNPRFFESRRLVHGLIFIILFVTISFNLLAQTVNLEEARLLALANSRSLARYEIAIRNSMLDERNQFYSMLPQVSADVRGSMYYLRNWEFVNPMDTLSLGASFSITQILFQGGKSFIHKAISGIATESVRIDARSEYFNVLDTIDNAYYAVLEAKAALEAEESSLQAAILGLSIAEVRHASGMINQGDYLRALADRETRENSFNQARRNYALSLNRFKTITGITEDVELEPVNFETYIDLLSELAGIKDEDIDILFNNIWNIMIKSNPSLAKAVLGSQRAERNHLLTIRDLSPTISATIFSTNMNFIPGGNSTGEGGVTIRGSIPVDFWVMNNRIERSRNSLESSLIDFGNTEISLEQELRAALSAIFSQAGSVLSSRRSLEYTERHFEFVMERYRLLQSSISELNDATTLYINSRNSLNRVTYAFLQSLSRLRSLCAIDNEDELLEILRGF